MLQLYNDAFAPILGARHPQALGRPASESWAEIWHDIGPMLRSVFDRGIAVWHEDFPLRLTRNGYVEQRYFTFSYSPIEDGQGVEGVICIVNERTRDVEHARRINERLDALIEFQRLAENVADLAWMHGPDGTIEWASASCAKITGLPLEVAMKPEGWAQVMEPGDFARYKETLADAVARRVSYEIELRIKPAAGTEKDYRWYFVRANPMFSEDGVLLRWGGVATDINDRRLALNETRLRLERERDREHRASLAFQDASLPKTLPKVPGLTFSAVYKAAEAETLVGGDWYDAFRLSDGRIVLSVGDVMGSGLVAAVTMNAVRQAIRGAAQIYPDPASVLDAADRTLRSEQPDRIVTAFVAVLDPLLLTMTFASAGHPAPLLRLADGTISELSAPDLPLGLRSERRKTRSVYSTVAVPPGSLLVLYTDGLTETTRDIFEGERRLRSALARSPEFDPREAAQRIRDEVLVSSNDDVAILTMSVAAATTAFNPPGLDVPTRWTIPISDADAAPAVRREVRASLERIGATADEAADAELVLGELLGNVMRHAIGDAQIMLDLSCDEPVLHVLDNGPGFAFHARLPRDTLAESGRGLYIAAMLTRDLNVAPRTDGGSHARVVLNIENLRPHK